MISKKKIPLTSIIKHFKTAWLNYYVQIIYFVCIVVNQMSNIWYDDDSKYISLSGKEGFSNWFHYWLVYDHYTQYFMYILCIIMLLLYPLQGRRMIYALMSTLLYAGIGLIEFYRYMYHGNNNVNHEEYVVYLSVYVLGHIILILINKAWK